MSPKTKDQFEQIRKESKAKILGVAFNFLVRKDIKTQAYQRLRNWRGVKGLGVSLFSNKEELIKQLLLDVFEETDELLFLISHTPIKS